MRQNGMPFTKMHGSGNDFVVVDNRDAVVADASAFAMAVCARGVGLGCDGVVLLADDDDADVDFVWRYLNADGSDGDLCGNGAMCAARFAYRHEIAGRNQRFRTPAGVIEAAVDDATRKVTVRMVDARLIARGLDLAAADGCSPFSHYLVGVPHVVAIVDDADAVTGFHELGKRIRHDARLAPAGANVNLISGVDAQTIRMRTYERGVEAETLACGTGSVASAVDAVRRGIVTQPVQVITSSRLGITISWDDAGSAATNVRMAGEARFVASGTIDPELFV